MSWTDEELIDVLKPLFAQVEEQRESLTAAGVPQEAVGRALAGHAAKLLLGAQGPDLAHEVFARLAEDMETAAAMSPGASKNGGGESTPRPGATPEQIMAGAVRGAAAQLAEQGVDDEMISAHALAVAGAMVAQLFGRDGAAERLVAFAKEITEAHKRPTGRA